MHRSFLSLWVDAFTHATISATLHRSLPFCGGPSGSHPVPVVHRVALYRVASPLFGLLQLGLGSFEPLQGVAQRGVAGAVQASS